MLNMTTTHSVGLFMTALQGQNYSPKTLRAYGDDLKQFLEWVGENRVDWDTPKRFGRVDIEGFMSALAGQQMTGVTRVRKLAALRKFFTFLEENHIELVAKLFPLSHTIIYDGAFLTHPTVPTA